MADRTASAVWQGDLFTGSGLVSATSSGLFSDATVTWTSRTEAPGGTTSPEELLAAAHAACFSMAFSNQLSSRGAVPVRMEVEATVTFQAPKITKVVLAVTAEVPDADDATFAEALAAAEGSGCPVSNALRGNVEIEVHAARR